MTAWKNPGLSFASIELVDTPWFPYLCTEADGWQWQTAIPEHSNLWIVLGGSGYLRCDGQGFRLEPGLAFVFVPGQTIEASQLSGKPIQRFAAHFRPVMDGRPRATAPEFPLLGRKPDHPEALRRNCAAVMRESFRHGAASPATHAAVYTLLAGLVDARGTTRHALSPEIAEAVRRMQHTVGRCPPAAELARAAGMSRSHFDREFTRQMGLTPRRFLLARRLTEARRLLANSELRVTEIAESLGYADVYFFSRQFKQHTGLPPTAYRQKHR